MSGLPASLGHRFLDGFYVAPSGSWSAERMVMRIARGDRERADIVTELFKYLRYRYEETERILVHHTKLSADAMIGKLLAMWCDELLIEELRAEGIQISESKARDVDAVLAEIDDANIEAARGRVAATMESLFLRCGDDGVLEHIAERYESPKNSRQDAICNLTNAVLDRNLYKLIGKARETAGLSVETVFNSFGSPERKREIEKRVADFAGLAEGWHLLLWIPHPEMRLKPADVLVTSDGRKVTKLRDHRRHHDQSKAITDSHRDLWAVSVYAPSEVAHDRTRCAAILAELSREMGGLEWEAEPEQHADAEAVVSDHIANTYRLSHQDQMRIESELRSGNASVAARTTLGETSNGVPTPNAPQLSVRTYDSLLELAEALALSLTSNGRELESTSVELDQQNATTSFFDLDGTD